MGSNSDNFKALQKVIIIFIGLIAVAALSVIVYKNIQDRVYKVLYKQAFARANYSWQQAVMLKEIEYPFSIKNSLNNFKAFQSKFHQRQSCSKDNMRECWNEGESFFLIYPTYANSASFIDDRGMAWANACSFKCSGEILVDVNGLDLPNQYGKDRFAFYPTTAGVGYRANKPYNLSAFEDYKYSNEYFCPSGHCLYNSWLY